MSETREPLEEKDTRFASFWTRIFALIIDVAILGLIGLVLGLLFSDFFASTGNNFEHLKY